MADKLHYDMAELERDYSATYGMFMKAGAIGIVGAVIYFFILAVYLGGWGHTPATTFVQTFAADGRIDYDYKGTKLPMFADPASVAVAAKPVAEASVTPSVVAPASSAVATAVTTSAAATPKPAATATPPTPPLVTTLVTEPVTEPAYGQ